MNLRSENKILPDASSPEDFHSYFEAIVESSNDAIISKDLNGVIRSWNPAAQKIFGYTAEEAVGKSVTMLIPSGYQNEEPNILARIRRGEKIDHYETIRMRKDGSLLNISLTVSPIRDAQGHIIGASKIARDISDQKKAIESVRVAQEALALLNEQLEARVKERTLSLNQVIAQMEEFSYSVSHDLRSPVRAMQAYARVIAEDYGSVLDATAHDYLSRIIRSGARMDKLILDLLVYSRVARQDIELRPVALEGLIQDIIDQYPEMQSPKAEITIPGPLPKVVGHEPSLTQAISNILANAVKFVAPGVTPKVDIRAESQAGNVTILIQDNGIGILPEHRGRLFGMFERATRDSRYEGTGIGLAIVKKAVERMGGKVELVPEAKKNGTVFRIVLRAAAD